VLQVQKENPHNRKIRTTEKAVQQKSRTVEKAAQRRL
jgi:hypothetical protein